jgi:hypothetical protein
MDSLRTVETGQINSMREEIEKAKRLTSYQIQNSLIELCHSYYSEVIQSLLC